MKNSKLLLLALVALPLIFSGCATPGPEPLFDWVDNYATPGTSLELVEIRDPKINYKMKATGFAADESLSLWRKGLYGYNRFSVVLGEDNFLRWHATGTKDTYELRRAVHDYVLGLPLKVALVSDTTGKRAHAKVFPYPIQAKGDGGCSILVEVLTDMGDLFAITGDGFLPGEEVQTLSKYKDENLANTRIISENQRFKHLILYGPLDRGKATYSATSPNCTVSVDYNVGKDAIVRQ